MPTEQDKEVSYGDWKKTLKKKKDNHELLRNKSAQGWLDHLPPCCSHKASKEKLLRLFCDSKANVYVFHGRY